MWNSLGIGIYLLSSFWRHIFQCWVSLLVILNAHLYYVLACRSYEEFMYYVLYGNVQSHMYVFCINLKSPLWRCDQRRVAIRASLDLDRNAHLWPHPRLTLCVSRYNKQGHVQKETWMGYDCFKVRLMMLRKVHVCDSHRLIACNIYFIPITNMDLYPKTITENVRVSCPGFEPRSGSLRRL